jgi:Response regulator containing CheY-like receiver domain and AraC-type DNA-binding domain
MAFLRRRAAAGRMERMTPHRPGSPHETDDAVRLEAAVRLVDEVAHDLNNALLVIRGYSTILRATLEAPEQLADVDEITKAADHATSLTGRLHELGHPRASGAVESLSFGDLDQSTETILLVEDEQLVRELVCRVLESAGYRVLPASSPSEAELLLEQEHSVDLLLTDVVMPEMSGYELAARVSDSRPELRVLFISGYAYAAAGPPRIDAELLQKRSEERRVG